MDLETELSNRNVRIDKTSKVGKSITFDKDINITGNSELSDPTSKTIIGHTENKLWYDINIHNSSIIGNYTIYTADIIDSTINSTNEKEAFAIMYLDKGKKTEIINSKIEGNIYVILGSKIKDSELDDVYQTQFSTIDNCIVKGMDFIGHCTLENCAIVGVGGHLINQTLKDKIIVVNGESEPDISDKVI